MTDDALEFLMSAGVPSAKFPTPGTIVKGRIRGYEKAQQRDIDGNPKCWDDGSPMWQVIFTLETSERDPEVDDDDGARKLYAKAQMLAAIRDAVRKTHHEGGLVGGELAVKYQEDGPKTNPRFNAPKIYRAVFAPPEPLEAFDELPDDNEEPF